MFGIKNCKEKEKNAKNKSLIKEKTSLNIAKYMINAKDELLIKHVQHIEAMLAENQNERHEDKLREEKELKFKLAATVMDRLFFFLAIFYFIVTFSSILLAIPNFYK